MGQRQPIQFAAQSYQARAATVSLERLVNLYLESNPSGAKGPTTLYRTPGLKLWKTVGDGPIRGVRAVGALLYVVSGGWLYAVNSIGVVTTIGEVDGTGNVLMTDNEDYVITATHGVAYASNLTEHLALPEGGFNGVTYQDGYGIYTEGGTEKFWISGLDDLTTINGLDFSTADAFADKVVGCISDHRELWLFGENSTEVWANAGLATFPFVRMQGGFIERGCGASGSIAKAQNSVLWLGEDGAVYAAAGYTPKRISTEPIERLIEGVADSHSAVSFTYTQAGHTFYVLTFAELTIVYDITTGLWHERISDEIDRWRANCYATQWDLHLAGDYASGKIYELDLSTYDDDGATLRWEATAPPIYAGNRRVAMPGFEIEMETGVGITVGQGDDPEIMLDWSDDGGNTWSSERTAKIGRIGAPLQRVSWNRLGTFRERTMRIAGSDPVSIAITGATADLEVRQ